MELLTPTYKASILAIEAVISKVGKDLLNQQIDYLPGKHAETDPNDLHIAVWIVKKQERQQTIEAAIYCYYIRADNEGKWYIRQCDHTDFTETRFISCPLHFLNKVNLDNYDPLWVKAVRSFHSNKLQNQRARATFISNKIDSTTPHSS